MGVDMSRCCDRPSVFPVGRSIIIYTYSGGCMSSLQGKVALTIARRAGQRRRGARRGTAVDRSGSVRFRGRNWRRPAGARNFMLIEFALLTSAKLSRETRNRAAAPHVDARGRNFSRGGFFFVRARHGHHALLLPADRYLCNRHDR